MLAADRDAGRVNLRVAGVGKECALLVCAPGGGDVAALGIGGEEEYVAIPARRQHDRIGRMGRDFARGQVAHHDALGMAVDHDQVEHLGARIHLHRAQADLAAKRLVRAEQKLLASLAARIERPGDLRPAERAVRQGSAANQLSIC